MSTAHMELEQVYAMGEGDADQTPRVISFLMLIFGLLPLIQPRVLNFSLHLAS